MRTTSGFFVSGRREQFLHAQSVDELRLELARRRVELRRLEAEIASLRREHRFFRRVGFGRDIKDIQLVAMQDQHDYLAGKALEIERRLHPNPVRRGTALAWLLLPVMMALLVAQPLLPRRSLRHASTSAAVAMSPGSSSLVA